jgi:tryptophanyl-tRNA synthetase
MTKRILTWLQATSSQIHIGNYFGAIKPMLELSKQFPDAEVFLFLAIMHSLTRLHDSKSLRENSLNILKIYLACGVDLNKFVIYNPADVPAHAQLIGYLLVLLIWDLWSVCII